MDGNRFDDLARALARPASRRVALAALAALLPAGAAPMSVSMSVSMSARRPRGCRPKCGAGFVCEGRECVCPSSVTCGAACCGAGQACQGGACATPEPACISAGEPCKGIGRACCDRRVCASGQGGQDEVACWVPAGGPCATTSDCVYGATCRGGRCVADVAPRCTVCPENCPHTTIEGAVADPGFPVVTVAAGVYRPLPTDEAEGLESGLVIRRSVVIEACGDGTVTIDGEGTHRVVRITHDEGVAPTVTLRNLVIANGVIGGGGGGICLERGSLDLDGVIVRDNQGTSGGGVYAVGSTSLTVTGASRITGNSASDGGGIFAAAGSTVDIGGSTLIRGNTSATGAGVSKAPEARLTIRDRAAITGNTATATGGGVESDDGGAPIPVSCVGSPTVCENSAPASCGPNCRGAFEASCTAVCCSIGDNARGEVGAAAC